MPTAALADTGLDKVLVSVWLLTVVKTGKELGFESVEEAEVECRNAGVDGMSMIDVGASAGGRRRGMKVRGTRMLGPQGSPALTHSRHR